MPDTGLKYATSVANNAGAGSLAWSNTSNAVGNNTNDATYTHVETSGISLTSQYLIFTFAHGLTGGETIDGIVVAFRRYGSDIDDVGLPSDLVVQIVKDGSLVGSNKSAGASWPNGTGAWSSDFGGAADVWGSSFTSANTIGVALRCDIPGVGDYARVTAARATFYYTSGGGADTTKFFFGAKT